MPLQNLNGNRVRILFTGLLLILLIPCPAYSDIQLLQLINRPDSLIELSQLSSADLNWAKVILIHLRLPMGASQGILFFVDAEQATITSVNYVDKSSNAMLSLFSVADILLKGDKKVADPLIPVSPGNLLAAINRQLFYIRITAMNSAKPGKYKQQVIFKDSGGNESRVKIEIEVLPFGLPMELPITIQANIWPYQQWTGNKKTKAARLKNVLKLLSTYRINGVSGMLGSIQSVDSESNQDDLVTYKEVVYFCLHDLHFRRVRLPAQKMFNSKAPLSGDFPDKRLRGLAFEKNLKMYFDSLGSLIKNPKWTGKLGFKLWDEPKPRDYPDVVLSYRIAKKISPSLKLELSEQPEPELHNVADVWTPYIKFLSPSDVDEQHRLGKEVWIYANEVHGIDHPLHGMRILGWLLWKYHLDGYLFWAINWWKEDPWKTVSSKKKDFLKRGTLVYPDPRTGKIYPSLRLEAFRDGIEDMLLLREVEKLAQGNGPKATKAKTLLSKLKNVYSIAERFDHAPNPAVFREEIMEILF
jgi:hypothetical protein